MSAPSLTGDLALLSKIASHVLGELKSKNTDFHGQPLLVFGPCDDAANPSAPAIFWSPTNERYAPAQRLGGPAAPGPLINRGVPVSFLLFGGVLPDGTYSDDEAPFHDCDLTEELQSKLVNCLHRSLSQQSYALDSANWFNSGRTGIGMSLELVVEFKLSIIREDNPTVKVTATHITTEIAHP